MLCTCFYASGHEYLTQDIHTGNTEGKHFHFWKLSNRCFQLTLALIKDQTMVVVSSLWMSLEKQSAFKKQQWRQIKLCFNVQGVDPAVKSDEGSPAAHNLQIYTLPSPGHRRSGHPSPLERSPKSWVWTICGCLWCKNSLYIFYWGSTSHFTVLI